MRGGGQELIENVLQSPRIIELQPQIPQSCQLLRCSFFYQHTANPGNAARPGGEELRMSAKQQEFAQTWGTVTQGERAARG